jgi:hypothetical protein
VLVLIGTTTMRGHTKTFDARRFVEGMGARYIDIRGADTLAGGMSRFAMIWRDPENHRADE